MENFTFCSPTKIIFGRDTENDAGKEVKQYSSNILLHYGQGSIKKSGLYDRVTRSLDEAGVSYTELDGVLPNPRLSLVREGVELCRKNDIDFILSVGGGSAADSAKAISIGVPYSGDVWDFYTSSVTPEKAIPVGVVLTLPATGTEASKSSVITDEKNNLKRPLNDDLIRPVFSILNPELTFTLPPYQTACGAVDIMSHVIERYFTNTTHVDVTDRLCEALLKTVVRHAKIVLEEPENYNSRAEIMWAGTLAHNDIVGTGRVGDWSSHMIEHEISGIYDLAHGAGLAIVIPAWMKYVYRKKLDRFVQFAVRVWNVEMDYDEPERTAYEGIERFVEFLQAIGMPTTLSKAEIGDDRLDEMASSWAQMNRPGNLVELTKEDVLKILRLAA